MPAFTSTDIANRALQKLGAARISAITADTPSARACNLCYENLRLSLLRMYRWKFAIKQIQLAEDATEPAFSRAATYTLPADYVMVLPPLGVFNTDDLDWIIQGGKLYTDTTDELDLRYVADISNVSLMDPLFREALSALMAREMAEVITQSNTKKTYAAEDFKEIIAEAKRASSFEGTPQSYPDTSWVTCRDI